MPKIVAIVFLFSLSSCGLFSGIDPEKRKSFGIENIEKTYTDSLVVTHLPSSFRIEIKGNLTDSAKIVWAYTADALTDSNSSIYNSAVLKKGKVKFNRSGDFYNKVLYFRYMPYNPNTKGDLKIKLTLL